LAKGLSRQQLLQYARAGAQARIAELRRELAALEAAFGDGRLAGRQAPTATIAGEKKSRRNMSAAARRRIGQAAKRRWAKWRAEKKAK
jgi:hypothetical protein